jgi:hypothetical protein
MRKLELAKPEYVHCKRGGSRPSTIITMLIRGHFVMVLARQSRSCSPWMDCQLGLRFMPGARENGHHLEEKILCRFMMTRYAVQKNGV